MIAMKADDVFNRLDLGVTARHGNLEFALAETQNAGREVGQRAREKSNPKR